MDDESLYQIPTITLRGGELTLDPPGPHYIKEPETGRLFLILDTEATVDTLDRFDGDLAIFNRSQFISRNARTQQVRVQELSQFPDFTLDEPRLRRMVAWITRWLGVTFYFGALPISFAYRLVQALLYGGAACILGKVLGVTLAYRAGIRLATIAVTPPLLLGAALDAFGATPRALFWWPTCLILALAYLSFGVRSGLKGVGVSHKLPGRLLRFQTLVQLASRPGPRHWSALALDAGSYDQAHLVSDFRAMTGTSPVTP